MKEKDKSENTDNRGSSDNRHYKKHRHRQSTSSSNSSDSEEWVEKRETWMSMTGMLKTYTKDDIKTKIEEKNKKHIDSYNPATCSRELNPYWKHGGNGLPQKPESYRKSRPFKKPSDDSDYYTKSSSSRKLEISDEKPKQNEYGRSYNWKKESSNEIKIKNLREKDQKINTTLAPSVVEPKANKEEGSKYLSDEKMNKLASKIVKAEILGDTKLVIELKAKLEAAREYRKQNPQSENEDDRVMLMSTNSAGNSMPLSKRSLEDPRSKGEKRKAETHVFGERAKYFGNDDKYNLAQMFQKEKYGNNYDDEAQFAKITAKHKNPNDDLEDIFVDEISKNNDKDSEKDKQRAINQHVKMEKSLQGCEHCFDSKNMLKHLIVSCGNKVYVAVPARKSLVKSQCIITTIQHNTCVTSLDEDVWEEVMNYRKALTKFYNSQHKDVVFYETATRLHRYPHMIINCVPLPRDVGDMASIYFKKALLECETEWSMNKKVVDLKSKNIRSGVPKGLPYFWIDFGMDPGFAHVIEDQQLFPKSFAEEVIAGILDLDHNLWKNPKREYGDVQRKKVLEFVKEWKPFDIVKNKE